ncbi:MAG: NAD-dependent epimerase/dehydratase family protein, partial [Candidatus Acidiferrales bacterium]
MHTDTFIINLDAPILITGSNGFIGSRVVETLIRLGFSNLRCFVRPSSNLTALSALLAASPGGRAALMAGNLLSREDCARGTRDVQVIFHLAAGIEKTFPGSFLNSVITTRNLLDAAVESGCLKRFVNISSLA